jgi:hypothetical protein
MRLHRGGRAPAHSGGTVPESHRLPFSSAGKCTSVARMERLRFEAVLQPNRPAGTFLVLPAEVSQALGGRARIPVEGTIAGEAFRGSTMPMGDGSHCLGVSKALQSAAGVEQGDRVLVELARDDAPRTVEVPDDLAAALAQAGLRERFDRLSYTHRREHVQAIEGSRRTETRARRIERCLARLRE